MVGPDQFAEELTQLPIRPGVGHRLLTTIDDPRSSAQDLGRLIESDPALTAQVMRLANSAFYGFTGEIASAWRAVTVLGHTTVRALATSAAFGLLAVQGESLPANFWDKSTMRAAAAMVLARSVNVAPDEAFSMGLMLDVGQALMFRKAPVEYVELLADCDRDDYPVIEAERERFGMTHADIGSLALASMHFPLPLVEAIHDHHRLPEPDDAPLTRVAIGAAALAQHIEGGPPESDVTIEDALAGCGIGEERLADVCVDTLEAVSDLSGFLAIAN